jgi:hypothetical protein
MPPRPKNNHLARLRALTVPQLRALTWKYAVDAANSVDAARLCIDPSKLDKASLIAHLNTAVPNSNWKLAIPATPELWLPVEQAFLQMTKKAIQLFLSAAIQVKKKKRGRSPTTTSSDDLVGDDAEEADDQESIQGHDGDSDTESKEPEEGQIKMKEPTSTTSRTKRRRTSPPPGQIIICTRCETPATFGEHGLFCMQCGQPWKGGVSSSSPSSTSTTATVASSHPTTWPELASFTPTTVANMARQFPDRSTELSPVPSTVIDKARAGQQHYTLTDLLQPRAPDPSAASSSVQGDKAFLMRFDDDGGFKMDSGIDATLATSLTQRKRKLTSFADIAEVILFVLIPRIYHDRPDICEQLLSLLYIAHEINRRYLFPVAIQYVDNIRFNHFNSVPPKTHVLHISTSYSLGMLHTDVLNSIVFRQNSSSAGWTSAGSTTSTLAGPATGRREPQSGDNNNRTRSCRNWNRRAPCRESPCRWPHVCSKCGSSLHPSSQCTQGTSISSPSSSAPSSEH